MPFQEPGGGGGELPPVNEPGQKGGRGGPPPGGGPGGGPGFTSFGGFGGVRPQVFRGLQGLGQDIPIIMRKRQIPGITPGPPGRTDTVPAMLSPGEMVMNRGVTSDPQWANLLAMLNMQGAQQQPEAPVSQAPMGFERGGMVPGERFCPHCGRPQEAEGYQWGGFVRPQSPFGGQQAGGAGFFGRSRPADQRPAPPPAPGGAPGGYQYNPEGGVVGGFRPSDPWGPYRENRDPRVYGQAVRGLGGFGEAGYFDPRGNQALIASMEQGAQGTADALVRRGMTQADLGGMDPAQRAVAKLQAQRETGRGVQDIMAQTRAGALQSQNQFAQDLYKQLLGGDLGFTGQTNEARLQDWLAGKQQGRQGGGFGSMAGGLVGAGIGGYFGGPEGAKAGYGVGSGLGGRRP